MISVTKLFKFEACHHLPDYVGKCHNLHGHSYHGSVTVSGVVNKSGTNKGMIMDFGTLKSIINDLIVDRYDHTNLNDLFEVPTAENMVEEMSCMVKAVLPESLKLESVKLWETDTSYAEWTPED